MAVKFGSIVDVTVGSRNGPAGVYNVTATGSTTMAAGLRNVAQDGAPDERDKIPYGTKLKAIWTECGFIVFYVRPSCAAKGAD